jgi:acetamidase/formamidase
VTIAVSGHLGRDVAHHVWDRSQPAALTVPPGSVVELALRDGSNGQIGPRALATDLLSLDLSRMDPLTGPVWVEGARRGDGLLVEVLEISLAAAGWSAIIPGLGLLADRFPGPLVRTWDLRADEVDIGDGHFFKLAPMLGVVGVAPPNPGRYPSTVPTPAGGNMDIKYVRPGSRIMFPVFAEGGLLSLGDAHALQGDGELSGTAIECEATAVIRVDVVADMRLQAPFLDTVADDGGTGPFRSFLGVGPDLYAAAQEASLRAVDGVATALGLGSSEAYALLGTIAELRIHEVVDRPNWVVGCMVPLRLFTR